MSSVRLLLAFAESAKQGSFARAARELGLSPSAVAKSVQRLEEELGLRLFHRTTRRVGLTPEGEALFERCRRILDDLAELELHAAHASRAATGTLRIDVPLTYGRLVVLPAIAKIALGHPELRVDVRLSDRFADVIGGGLDAVIRIGEIADSRLVARTFDVQRLGVYGAPAYFARKGRPKSPGELEAHECAVFRMPTTGRPRTWQFEARGKPIELHPEPKYMADDGEGLLRMAAAGLALVQAPDYMARAEVASGELEEVLAPVAPRPLPISIVYPSNRHVPLRLRLLVDALAALDLSRPAHRSRARPPR